jgi:hypothetical protein
MLDYVNKVEELTDQLLRYQHAFDILIKYKNAITIRDRKKLKELNL